MPSGVYKRTEYHNKINAKGHKGQVPWIKGRKMSDEFREKIRKASLDGRCGMKGKKFTDEHKQKIGKANSIALKGRKVDKKVCLKISKTLIKKYNINDDDRIYSVDWTETLRRSIRERDKYICKLCGSQQGDISFAVHHIDYDKYNCNPNNLITLCNSCHAKTNHNRKDWIKYFKSLEFK